MKRKNNFSSIQWLLEEIDVENGNVINWTEVEQKSRISQEKWMRIFEHWGEHQLHSFLLTIESKSLKKLLFTSPVNLFSSSPIRSKKCTEFFRICTTRIPASNSLFYSLETTIYGQMLIASTENKICFATFEDNGQKAVSDLQHKFPGYSILHHRENVHQQAIAFLHGGNEQPLQLWLQGTPFQIQTWEALLLVSEGTISTYGAIAERIQKPNASRAVGTAIGKNPIAYFVPCHRIVQQTGKLGGFRWGLPRKKAMLGKELLTHQNKD